MPQKQIILSTEDLNGYGTWLPIAGARMETFRKNPVMFYDHNTYHKPIGHWENIRIENGKIIAEPVFDEGDEEALEVKRKYENGDIRGASLGVDILELSDDPAYLKQGQTRSTIKVYEVFEASLTPLPGNTNCLQLRKSGLQLSTSQSPEAVNVLLPEIKPIKTNMEKTALKLGLSKDASEDQVIAKIEELQLKEKHHATLSKFVDKQAESLQGDKKELYASLSKTDPENALKVLALGKDSSETADPAAGEKPGEKKTINQMLDEKVTLSKKSADVEDKETFDYLQKNDPEKLLNLKRTDPAKYDQLAAGYLATKRKKR